MSTVPSTVSTLTDWEVTSRAHRRRSLPPTDTLRPLKKKRNACAALCAEGVECTGSVPPLDGARWCPRHNEERRKLYSNYKNHEELLREMPDVPACRDGVTIMACDELPLLQDWNEHLRRKYNLLTRCIEARDYFTRRFFGEDMDFGHKTYWEGLKRERSQVEQMMSHVETRGYQLMLQAQNAMWVLKQDTHGNGTCSVDKDISHKTGTPTYSAYRVEDNTIEDPLEAALREKATQFRENIKIRLAWYCAPLTSRFHSERLEVIYAYVRRAIYKDASLMFLLHGYVSVLALLGDKDLDLVTTEKLWHAISTLCMYDIQSAVDDVIRSTDGDYVVVLGGRVFKNISGERWPLHAWGHMAAIHRCYDCLRGTCRTIDEVIDLTRYSLLTGARLPQKDGFTAVDGSKELILAGFIASSTSTISPRHSIVSKELDSQSICEETICNICLCAGLSLSDPKAQAFVNGCIRYPGFLVMLRKGADARIIRSSPFIWTCRKRCAQNHSALALTPWVEVGLTDLALEEAKPCVWPEVKISECLQVIVVDAGQGTMRDFVRKLLQIWCQVYEVSDKKELYDVLRGRYEAAGELEAFQGVTAEIALASYQQLWGCEPPPEVARDLESFRVA